MLTGIACGVSRDAVTSAPDALRYNSGDVGLCLGLRSDCSDRRGTVSQNRSPSLTGNRTIESDADLAGTLISQAIAGRKVLRFDYAGLPRIVEPQTYGLDRLGQRMLVAFQVSGASKSGDPHGWKTFRQSSISKLVVGNETFSAPAPGYQRDDGLFASIISQV